MIRIIYQWFEFRWPREWISADGGRRRVTLCVCVRERKIESEKERDSELLLWRKRGGGGERAQTFARARETKKNIYLRGAVAAAELRSLTF